MKRMSLVLVVGLLAATILAGCVIVPLGGWGWGYGDGGYYGGRGYYRGPVGATPPTSSPFITMAVVTVSDLSSGVPLSGEACRNTVSLSILDRS